MTISYELFTEWAKGYFGDQNIMLAKGGEEICTHSPFVVDDQGHNLWMNPSGGKSKHPENGSYRCWKSDRRGSLVSLVARLENIDFDEAEGMISNETSLRALEQKLSTMMFGPKNVERPVITNVGNIHLPNESYLISALRDGTYKQRAINYLEKRKIQIDGLYVGIGGNYDNRIIIPYYNANRQLIWFNARTMSNGKNVIKYLKPNEECGLTAGVNQDQVLFMKRWPRSKSRVFIMEGEFDAMSLDIAGFYAAAVGGKTLSDSQIEMVRQFIPVLSFDNDKHGKKAVMDIGELLLSRGFGEVYYIRPPEKYKDWNEFLEMRDTATIKAYIEKNTKPFTTWTVNQLRAKNL